MISFLLQSLYRAGTETAIVGHMRTQLTGGVMEKQHKLRRERQLILVVDDDVKVAQILVSLFEEEGYTVNTARDGVSALQQIRKHKPAFVVTDVIMPRMDGITLARRIAANWASLPVVLMSSADRPTGIDIPFIQKPFDLDDVLTTVHQLDHNATNEMTSPGES